MKQPSRTVRFLLGVGVLLIVAGECIWWLRVRPALRPPVAISQVRGHWMKQIRESGAPAAYVALKREYAAAPHGKRHEMTHLFGEVLYQSAGVDGIAVCDGENEFGCYHGFLSRAVRDRGTGIIHELDAACIRHLGPTEHACQHGIGHGILEYLGREKLVEALDLCAQLSWKAEIGGCSGGVFMEYNLPTVLTADGVATGVRPLTGTNVFEPCDSIPAQYRIGCLFTIVQWWGRLYDHDFARLGQLCMQLTVPKERTTCFEGVGQIAAPTNNYNVDRTIAACALMPVPEAVTVCTRQASWSTWSSTPNRSDAPAVCAQLPAAVKAECAPGQ